MQWVSAHIYYGNLDKLLTKCICPLIESLEERRLINKFFFIKYFEKGLHLRLRVKCKEEHSKIVESLMITHVDTYLNKSFFKLSESTPSIRSFDANIALNTIRFQNYEQELARYGGEVGMEIAQEIFELSSRVTLAMLKQDKLRDYSDRIGAALSLHFSFAHAFKLSLRETAAFFEEVFHVWNILSINYMRRFREKQFHHKEHLITIFDEIYTQKEAVLIPYFKSYWYSLENGHEFDEYYLNEWSTGCNRIFQMYDAHSQKGLIDIQTASFTLNHLISNGNWAIFQSYFHMHNNRLGIDNKDEAYVAYLLMKISKSLLNER